VKKIIDVTELRKSLLEKIEKQAITVKDIVTSTKVSSSTINRFFKAETNLKEENQQKLQDYLKSLEPKKEVKKEPKEEVKKEPKKEVKKEPKKEEGYRICSVNGGNLVGFSIQLGNKFCDVTYTNKKKKKTLVIEFAKRLYSLFYVNEQDNSVSVPKEVVKILKRKFEL
jgi:hypothetical protein